MKIHSLSLYSFEIPFIKGQIRSGFLINIIDEKGNEGWGEISPLPNWSKETLKECSEQLHEKYYEITKIDWNANTYLKELSKLKLFPSVVFGLESALLSILAPLPAYTILTSALLMGSVEEILNQAALRHSEGYTSAKLKVSNLSFEEASSVIHTLKDKFRLRIDVNRAWSTSDSLRFFAQFPLDTFDYVEEPFQNPQDLAQFIHPLAIDESFPEDLSLEQLERLPTLKALIYKPTLQGGMGGCLSLHQWAINRGIDLVLSSTFESDIGLAQVASIAHRFSLSAPVGMGTFHHLKDSLSVNPLRFYGSVAHIPAQLIPNRHLIYEVQLYSPLSTF